MCRGDDVPQVGDKHYAYTREGTAAAKREAERTGKPMKNARKKKSSRDHDGSKDDDD